MSAFGRLVFECRNFRTYLPKQQIRDWSFDECERGINNLPAYYRISQVVKTASTPKTNLVKKC